MSHVSGASMRDLFSDAAPVQNLRPSTKLNSKFVGGQSQLGYLTGMSEESAQERKLHVDNRRYQTQISLAQSDAVPAVVPVTHAPHKNHSSQGFSLAHDPTPYTVEVHGGKKHFGMGEATAAPEATATEPIAPVKSAVQWASSSNGLGTVQSRPSSRVLRAPGGGSSIIFG